VELSDQVIANYPRHGLGLTGDAEGFEDRADVGPNGVDLDVQLTRDLGGGGAGGCRLGGRRGAVGLVKANLSCRLTAAILCSCGTSGDRSALLGY
jgi:hypothetical protein